MTTQPQLLQIALDRKDVVYTPDWVARDMVEFFKPTGRILEPCAGDGAFLKYLPSADWCEIEKGRDFFQCITRYDWIIGNPPYKQYANWMRHSYEISDNVVYLIPVNKECNSHRLMLDTNLYGGPLHRRIYGRGSFFETVDVGYAMGAIHFQRGYHGPIHVSFYDGPR